MGKISKEKKNNKQKEKCTDQQHMKMNYVVIMCKIHPLSPLFLTK